MSRPVYFSSLGRFTFKNLKVSTMFKFCAKTYTSILKSRVRLIIYHFLHVYHQVLRSSTLVTIHFHQVPYLLNSILDEFGFFQLYRRKSSHHQHLYQNLLLNFMPLLLISSLTPSSPFPEIPLRTRHIINSAHLLLYVLIFTIKVANRNSNN